MDIHATPITLGNLVTIVAVLSSALAVYFNFKKFGDSIRLETEWRTHVNLDIKNLLKEVTELFGVNKDTTDLIKELIEAKAKSEAELESIKKEIGTLWKRTDEHREDLKKLFERIEGC